MDLTDIPLPDDIQVFTCGPLPFMRHVRSTLLARGVPAARIRYEVFGPDLWAAQSPPPDSGTDLTLSRPPLVAGSQRRRRTGTDHALADQRQQGTDEFPLIP